jgi:hypothetical protein
MEEQLIEIKKELAELKENYIQLKSENDLIKEKYFILLEKKQEIYYQRFLEKTLNATHKKTRYGTTDITTDTKHIEIKHWNYYKYALGQLLSYNFQQDKELCAYFFGQISESKKNCIIELYKSKNVNIKEFIDTPFGIEIRNVLELSSENNKIILNKSENDDFYNWLEENIVENKNGIVKLAKICQLFFNNKSKVGVKEKGKLRKEIEKVIKSRYPQINNECQRTTIDGKPFQGWKGLMLKNT